MLISEIHTSGFGTPASLDNSSTIRCMFGASDSVKGRTFIERLTIEGPNQYCKKTITKLAIMKKYHEEILRYNPARETRKYTIVNIIIIVSHILNLSLQVPFI